MTAADDGWSGTSFDRPAFARMIGDIEAGKVNLVITKDLSRLGRDYIMTGHYMERYFPEKGVRYISLLDGVDTGVESSANDITPFRAIMNDMYAKDISKKITSVKRDKQRRGEFIGGKPVYGYQMHPVEKNKIVIDGTAAATVRRIFAMALHGMSCRQIAAKLNDEGVPTPAAYAGLPVARPGPYTGKWSGERISDMLQNETYIGNMVQGRQRKINYKVKKCAHQPREKWVVVPGTHEALIDRESFERVQTLLQSRRRTRSRVYDFLLRGMIFCHECGHPLGVINRKNAAGEDVLYFVCRTYQRFTKDSACTSHSIREERVTRAVLARVEEVCAGYLDGEKLLPIVRTMVEEAGGREGDADRANALRGRIQSLTAKMEQVYLDRIGGLLEEGDFRRIYEKLRGERGGAEAQLRALEQERENGPSARVRAEKLVRQFVEGGFENRELLLGLIERVELTKEKKIILRFRFRQPDGPEK